MPTPCLMFGLMESQRLAAGGIPALPAWVQGVLEVDESGTLSRTFPTTGAAANGNGTTLTITTTDDLYQTGDEIALTGLSSLNGTYLITRVGASSYTSASAKIGSATGGTATAVTPRIASHTNPGSGGSTWNLVQDTPLARPRIRTRNGLLSIDSEASVTFLRTGTIADTASFADGLTVYAVINRFADQASARRVFALGRAAATATTFQGSRGGATPWRATGVWGGVAADVTAQTLPLDTWVLAQCSLLPLSSTTARCSIRIGNGAWVRGTTVTAAAADVSPSGWVWSVLGQLTGTSNSEQAIALAANYVGTGDREDDAGMLSRISAKYGVTTP
jgi:hypothetical protein